MSNMAKPITMVKDEFAAQLRELINNCPLPYFIIESVLKDFYADAKVLAQQQLEADRARYRAAQETDGKK